MAYGLQIFNDNDKLQIGTDVSNFYMCQKGTINIQAGYEWDAFIYPTITPSVSYDGVAVCFDTGNTDAFVDIKSLFANPKPAGEPTYFSGIYAWQPNPSQSFPNINLNWYAFRNYRALPPATSGYGMELYNSDGTVGFTTRYPYILKGFRIPITNTSQLGQRIQLPPGRRFAFMTYGTTIISTRNNPQSLYGHATLAHMYDPVSNGLIVFGSPLYAGVDNSSDNLTTFTGGILVVDVTGY